MNQEVKYKKLYDKGKVISQEFGSSVYSLCSSEKCFIAPGERILLKTSLEIEIPENHFGLIFSKKELYIKMGLYVFQELILPKKKELHLAVMNVNIPKSVFMMSDKERFLGERSKIDIRAGDRIADMIIMPIVDFVVKDVS